MVVDRADEFVCDCTERSRDAYCEEEREENISQQAFFASVVGNLFISANSDLKGQMEQMLVCA